MFELGVLSISFFELCVDLRVGTLAVGYLAIRGVGSVSGLARPEMGTSKGGHPGKKMKIGTYVLMINAKLEKGKGFLVTSTSCMGAE